MILIDTTPLVALIDKADKNNHKKCVSVFGSLKSPPITTWPCLTEAFYLIGEIRGWVGQRTLLEILARGALLSHTPTENELSRIGELMEQYKDTPMSFADASLVSLAEASEIKTIFTLDSDFYIYRVHGKESFDVIPPRS